MSSNCSFPFAKNAGPFPKQCTGVCQNRAIEVLRINGQVRMSSSMNTMLKTAVCGQVKKDPKFASYDRLYLKRRYCATKR